MEWLYKAVVLLRRYKIKLHGSVSITIRNRIHLRRINMFKPTIVIRGSHHQAEDDATNNADGENSVVMA